MLKIEKKIFIRTSSLAFTLVISLTFFIFQFSMIMHRDDHLEDYESWLHSSAKQLLRLIHWQDELMLKEILEQRIKNDPHVLYAFIEHNNNICVSTLKGGIPKGLLKTPRTRDNQVSVYEFQNKKGEIFYDLAYSGSSHGFAIHFVVSQEKLDREYKKMLPKIMAVSLTVFVLGVFFSIGISRRITKEVHNMTSQLSKSEKRLSNFINSAVDSFTLWDKKLTLLDINSAGTRLLEKGVNKANILGKNITEIFPDVIGLERLDKYRDVIKTGEPIFIDDAPYKLSGEKRILQFRAFKVGDGLGIICSDVTVQKRMQEELLKIDKYESIGVLAGGIAHDFNNILAALLGNISLAKMKTDEQDDLYINLAEAEKAVEQATSLTNQLLTFSRGGAPIKETTDIGKLVKKTVSFVLSGSKVKGEYDIEEDIQAVEVDKGQISQMINNIVINSINAMPKGGIINISVKNTHLDSTEALPLDVGKYIWISIRDHGKGIPEDIRDKIFDPFFTTSKKGNGLGLATSQSIIMKHNGLIKVESEVGKGTTFHIYLPASKESDVKDFEDSDPDITGEGKILLMDDDEAVLKTASEILRLIGYKVTSVDDGAKAIDVYKKAMKSSKPFDAVILDLTVPGGMGGVDTIKNLIKIDPNLKAIATSGYSNDPVMGNHKKYGFCGVIPKPYSIKKLNRILSEALQKPEK